MALRQDFRKVNEAELAKKLADKQLDQFMADEAVAGKNPTEIGRMLVSSAAAAFQKIADLAKTEADNTVNDLMFTMLLDQIQQQIADIEARLAEIRRSLADVKAELVKEFGADFLLKNAEMYLKPDVFARKAGETDEEYEARMQEELEALMLDANGDIKLEYKDLTIAEFVMLKRQERELERSIDVLKDAHQAFERKVVLGEATSADKEQIVMISKKAGLSASLDTAISLKTAHSEAVSGLVSKTQDQETIVALDSAELDSLLKMNN